MKDLTDGAIARALGWAGTEAQALESLMAAHEREPGEQLIRDVRDAIAADRQLNASMPLSEPQLLHIVRQYAFDEGLLEQVALDVARATTTATIEQSMGKVQPAIELPPEARLKGALEQAKAAFWDALAASYPEINTGDVDVFVEQQFDQAADLAGTHWVEVNQPKGFTTIFAPTTMNNDDGPSI